MKILNVFTFMNCLLLTLARLEQGIFETEVSFNSEQYVYYQRSAFNRTGIEIRFDCKTVEKTNDPTSLTVKVVLRSSPCGKEFYRTLGSSQIPTNDTALAVKTYFEENKIFENFDYKSFWTARFSSQENEFKCEENKHIILTVANPFVPKKVNGGVPVPNRKKRGDHEGDKTGKKESEPKQSDSKQKTEDAKTAVASVDESHKDHPLFLLNADEIYLLIIHFRSSNSKKLNVNVTVKWKNPSGYLGPIDWPLLPFYGIMCGVYAFYALLWLVLSFCQWRDLLRIQFWIGAVIGLGLIEKMVFYMEHQTMNNTGNEIEGAMEFAAIFSCLKKTLSVMLVVIVSVGFGVVKPRLGSTLHKVVGFGFVYFLLCSIEGVVRVSKVQHESTRQKELIVLPLIFVMVGWFYWVFTSLVNTMRALRLKRNEVKLSMYRHFTHTLIFSCVASVGFMLWSLFMHHLNECMKDWKEVWVDTAFWHVLFSVLLMVIMILWRPTNNNQRYAFSPLLDNEDDEDEEEDTVFSEAFTPDAMKLRSKTNSNTSKAESRKNKENKEANSLEDELKWVEQHIPNSLADKTLPAFVDSDEEREQTKLEISKMQ